jgi:Holliday junction resolvase-like predicted endonuclease
LQQHPKAAKGACRFDVVSLSAGAASDGAIANIDWITDAFQA